MKIQFTKLEKNNVRVAILNLVILPRIGEHVSLLLDGDAEPGYYKVINVIHKLAKTSHSTIAKRKTADYEVEIISV